MPEIQIDDSPMTGSSNPRSVAARYKRLALNREPFLQRARAMASLTVAFVLPEVDQGQASKRTAQPDQSIGARGVLNLASKLLLTLMPVQTGFFRLVPERADIEFIRRFTDDQSFRTTVETFLRQVEKAVTEEIETRALRPPMYDALLHGVVTGNAVVYVRPRGSARIYHLDEFVQQRDGEGLIRTLITAEDITLDQISDADFREQVRMKIGVNENQPIDDSKEVRLYTSVQRTEDGESFVVVQEILEMIVPGSVQTFSKEFLPWISIRMNHIAGEHYGRGYVEPYMGDLRTAEGLSRALKEGAAMMAKMLPMIDPASQITPTQLTKTPNMQPIPGRPGDVAFLQVEKHPDFAFAERHLAKVETRLGFAFLLNSTIQRDAERVTAEEIRTMAQELNDALGGVFSLQSVEFQLPLVRVLIKQMGDAGELPPIPEGIGNVKPAIVTGLDEISRIHDLRRAQEFLTTVGSGLGPETLLEYVPPGDIINIIKTALGLDVTIRSESEIQANRRQLQLFQLLQNATPEMLKTLSGQINENIDLGQVFSALGQQVQPNGRAR